MLLPYGGVPDSYPEASSGLPLLQNPRKMPISFSRADLGSDDPPLKCLLPLLLLANPIGNPR